MIMFSIIMPVFNVEKTLERAIISVLGQSENNFELILVNDCSTDGSLDICKKYTVDSKITLINKSKNEGLSSARNSGLNIAKGDYVVFMDSDDWLEKNTLDNLYARIKTVDSDVVLFGFFDDFYNTNDVLIHSSVVVPPDYLIISDEVLHKEIINLELCNLYGFAWNKAYKRTLLINNQLFFNDITLIEDIEFNIRVFNIAAKVSFISNPFYHYTRQKSTSLTNKTLPDYWQLQHKRLTLLYNQLLAWNVLTEDVKGKIASILFRYMLSYFTRLHEWKIYNRKERIAAMKRVFDSDLFTQLQTYSMSNGMITRCCNYLIQHKKLYRLDFVTGFISLVKRYCPTFFILKKDTTYSLSGVASNDSTAKSRKSKQEEAAGNARA